jgi:hypothetical protein
MDAVKFEVVADPEINTGGGKEPKWLASMEPVVKATKTFPSAWFAIPDGATESALRNSAKKLGVKLGFATNKKDSRRLFRIAGALAVATTTE